MLGATGRTSLVRLVDSLATSNRGCVELSAGQFAHRAWSLSRSVVDAPPRRYYGSVSRGDARVHPRLSMNVHADVIGEEVVLGRELADISMGGCRILGGAWEKQGTEVQMVLGFGDAGANLPVHGLVVRASDSDMGIRFHRLSDEQKWALRKHMRGAQS